MNLVRQNLLSHSACVMFVAWPLLQGRKTVPTEGLASFPPMSILVPSLMFTLRYDITHGKSKMFLVVLFEEDH